MLKGKHAFGPRGFGPWLFNVTEVDPNNPGNARPLQDFSKKELCKNFKDLLRDENSYYELSSHAIALGITGFLYLEEDTCKIANDLNAEFSEETDSATFNEVYEDSFDEEQKIIVAWSWTYNFINEPKFENDIKNQKLLDIYSEVTSNGWNTILEDELKTESEYNNMVYFKI